MDPPVDEGLLSLGKHLAVDPQALIRGREVYLNRCISCHNIEPVARYTQDEWKRIVPDMARESNLDDLQEKDLLSYILIARSYTDVISADPHPALTSEIPQSP